MDCTWAGCVRERLPIGKQLPFLLRPQSPRPLGMQPVINSHASGIFVRGECWYHEQEICFALLREAVIFKDRPCPLYRHPTIHPVRVSPWFLKDLCFFFPPHLLHSEFPSPQQLLWPGYLQRSMIRPSSFAVLLPRRLSSPTRHWAFHDDQLHRSSLRLAV